MRDRYPLSTAVENGIDVLNCTVFNAATSHPNACITNVAIVFPTYLTYIQNSEKLLWETKLILLRGRLTHRQPTGSLSAISILVSAVSLHSPWKMKSSIAQLAYPTWLAMASIRVSGTGNSSSSTAADIFASNLANEVKPL